MSPLKAKTLQDVISLRRTTISTPKFWILTDENQVTLAEQIRGQQASKMVSVSKAAFDKFVTWYVKDQP